LSYRSRFRTLIKPGSCFIAYITRKIKENPALHLKIFPEVIEAFERFALSVRIQLISLLWIVIISAVKQSPFRWKDGGGSRELSPGNHFNA